MTFSVFAMIICLIVGFYRWQQQAEAERQNKLKLAEDAEKQKSTQTEIKRQFKKVDQLNKQIALVSKIKIPGVGEYKKTIIENEKSILAKGADETLFNFMKIDSFLNEFHNQILEDKKQVIDIDIEGIKARINYEANREHDLEYLTEKLRERASLLDGYGGGWEYKVENLYRAGNKFVRTLEGQIGAMNFYKLMGLAMLAFYLNDNKIRYFEIYEAFDKLGVFDSKWQKNVLSKLSNIEERLQDVNNSLIKMNKNFTSLLNSNETIYEELKSINSSIITGNMLQALTAYNTMKKNQS